MAIYWAWTGTSKAYKAIYPN